MKEISRREFIRKLLAVGIGGYGAGLLVSNVSCGSPSPEPTARLPSVTSVPAVQPTPPAAASTAIPTRTPTAPATRTPIAEGAYLAVARGGSPTAIVQAALKALGGIERFVKPGNDVIIKPNICTAYYTYEYAATTNPEVVTALVKLCLGAGAKRVRVMDYPFGGTPEQSYAKSGIAEAVKAAGGQMEVMASIKFQDTAIPLGKSINKWKVYRDALETDVLINVPIAKHHSLARLTLGMKNLMGLIENREQLHSDLGQRLADLTSLIAPDLTVIDAVRIMVAGGPTGGNLNNVKLTNTVIASRDIVAADTYAASLFGLTADQVPAISAGAKMGLGTTDLKGVQVEEVSV
ncbi:MAG: DUF362 domain-containing protein [Chloroflexota bacterium]